MSKVCETTECASEPLVGASSGAGAEEQDGEEDDNEAQRATTLIQECVRFKMETDMYEAAATTVQAIQRGHMARWGWGA